MLAFVIDVLFYIYKFLQDFKEEEGKANTVR